MNTLLDIQYTDYPAQTAENQINKDIYSMAFTFLCENYIPLFFWLNKDTVCYRIKWLIFVEDFMWVSWWNWVTEFKSYSWVFTVCSATGTSKSSNFHHLIKHFKVTDTQNDEKKENVFTSRNSRCNCEELI